MRRHLHYWEEVRRVFTPSPSRTIKLDWADEDFVRQSVFGVTSVELRCGMCGDVSERLLTGDHTEEGNT